MEANRILFVGGGTVGHINPILAIMEEVQKESASESIYVGLETDLASPIIQNSKLAFDRFPIRSGKLNRFLTLKHFSQATNLVIGYAQAHSLLGKLKPNRVFAKGGYVGVPVVLAAADRGIPIFAHETDLVPGLANRLVARYAKTVFTAFPVEMYQKLPKEKLLYVGQPVGSRFYQPQILRDIMIENRVVPRDRPLITIIGGSQGAHKLNYLLQAIWAELLETFTLVHLCGVGDYQDLVQRSEALLLGSRHRLYLDPFSGDIPELFALSTIIVSRSGGTIFEIAAARKPSVLLPLSTAAQNHQAANAALLEKAGAALVFDEREVTPDELLAAIQVLLRSPQRRNELGDNIARFDHPQAAQQIAQTILAEI